MFNKILIANRGEIACRVIKTARALGVRTVAVYSDADVQAQHVLLADEAVHIGPAPSRESYLLIDKVIAAAVSTGAEAIHPGYGFLSENAEFARACAAQNIVFIGPPVGAIEAMGSKSAAKQIMEKAGVPLVPGYHGADQNPELLRKSAEDMGYPVLLKAVAGGGGKGMRVVWQASELDEAIKAARREGENAFGNGDLLVEKYLTKPRHVEIQVFCDQHGNGVYLAERDCSIQRRHQKVIEEAPAPGLSETTRKAMGEAAVQAAQAINYVGAGTVEFLYDEDGSFYFMEMNTRLQVEHPVTEMITGQDLVEWQLRVATGAPLPLTQDQISINGHALEVRIYAEDPEQDFLPATGILAYLKTPTESRHVRVDTGVVQGDEVSMYYDPMIAKLIVWDVDRTSAIRRMVQALEQYRIGGLTTNVSFLHRLAAHPAFASADLDTGFITHHEADLFPAASTQAEQLPLLAAFVANQALRRHRDGDDDPWHSLDDWRLNASPRQSIELVWREEPSRFELVPDATGGFDIHRMAAPGEAPVSLGHIQGQVGIDEATVVLNEHRFTLGYHLAAKPEGQELSLFWQGERHVFLCQPTPDFGQHEAAAHGLTAPMNGTMVALLVEPGQRVEANTPLLVMEAMKMEHSIRAPSDGMVNAFYFQPGETVSAGVELVDFEEAEA
ncbi:acetyl/propionyl/methylcrotonyl-CoA carboxylase subunit alpha [Salinispirillum marinum]|uniref:Acetyl/propionyl/methylcrotonyl-CoA carboxylase subunit alpha n=2 Tax=Saccharospirillaceae TaxID=255527 RepID=A0ABV8BGU2_9GAMM